MDRLFDRRDTIVRLVLLDLSGVSYLVFSPGDHPRPTQTQWVLALLAFGTILALYRWPLVNALVQTALLGVAFCFIENATINQVAAGWSLLELAMWTKNRSTIWYAAALVFVVYLAGGLTESPIHVGRLVFGTSAVVGVPVLIGLVIRTSRELARQAEERAAEEQLRRESESRAARSDERSTIARELHDVVAHHVASIVLRIGVARHVLPDADPRVAEVFDDVHATGTAALADLRQLVAVLRTGEVVHNAALTAMEPTALPAALGATVETATRAGLTVDTDISPALGGLDAVRGLAVLRLTQEALTNVAKHAGAAAHARLRVAMIDGEVHWEVTDSGGIAPADTPPGGGHGITGMRERVEVLGGHLSAGPHGAGWRVHTVLPRLASSSSSPASSSASASAGESA
jgi:signal transduction histidine kinase